MNTQRNQMFRHRYRADAGCRAWYDLYCIAAPGGFGPAAWM